MRFTFRVSIVSTAVLAVVLLTGGCQGSGGTSLSRSQHSDQFGESRYLQVYEQDGSKLDDATKLMNSNCGTSVVPSTLCVVAAENALDADLAFQEAITDTSVPTRLETANRLLSRALSHAGRGFYLRISSLRDRSSAERDEAFAELTLAGRLLHDAYQALPDDVRGGGQPSALAG
jgi:hypothetical protein